MPFFSFLPYTPDGRKMDERSFLSEGYLPDFQNLQLKIFLSQHDKKLYGNMPAKTEANI